MDNTLTGPTYLAFAREKGVCAAAFLLSCGHGFGLFGFGVSAFLFSLALDLTCCLDWNLVCLVFP